MLKYTVEMGSLNRLLTRMIEDNDIDTIKKILKTAIKCGDERIVVMICKKLNFRKDKMRIIFEETRWSRRHLTPKMLNTLIENGLSINEDTNADFRGDERRLINNHNILSKVSLVKILLDNGVDADFYKCPYYHRQKPPLEIALVWGYYESAKLLLEHGADINYGYPYTDGAPTTLCYYVLYTHKNYGKTYELVQFMLESGADLSDPEKLRECCKDESVIKQIEEFYRQPKKRAKGCDPYEQ